MKTIVHPLRAPACLVAAAASFCAPSAFSQSPRTPTLRETVVSATRFQEPAASLPVGVSVITADEIRASGATTVNEALMRVLGVVGRQDFFGAGDFSLDLRGFGSTSGNNQVVILDGERLNESDTGSTRLASIPIDAVERIEVLRGSGAVLYGEGATGGVIVITTKAGSRTERVNSAALQAGAGSHRLRDLRANGTVAAGGFSFDVHGQKRESDNHRDHFRSDNEVLSFTGQWANEWLRAGVRHSRDDLDAQLPGALTVPEFHANARQSTAGQRSTAGMDGERTGVFGSARLGAWQFEADAARRERTVRSLFATGRFDSDIEATSYGLRARGESSFGGLRNILVIGHDQLEWDRSSLSIFPAFGTSAGRATQDSRAWYLKDDVVLAGGTRLSAGFRTERVRKEDSSANAPIADRQRAWELGASHPLSAEWVGYARVGRSFRLPAVDEFSFVASADTVLRPQVSRDVEIGLRRTAPTQKLEVRLFRSALTDEIGFDLQAPGSFGFGANFNLDPTRRQGIELDLTQQVASTVSLRLNAIAREAKFRSGPFEGKQVSLVPRQTVALRADWLPLPRHRVSGGVQWVGRQYADFSNTHRVPSYAVADLRYAFEWKHLELALSVNNLFDRKYYSQAFVQALSGTLFVYPEPGRTFFATAKVQF